MHYTVPWDVMHDVGLSTGSGEVYPYLLHYPGPPNVEGEAGQLVAGARCHLGALVIFTAGNGRYLGAEETTVS